MDCNAKDDFLVWKVVIMCHLIKGERRTSELKKLMPNITQKMLTQQLREL